jgi:hypothetical protein
LAGYDGTSTEAYIALLVEGMPVAKAERLRQLMIELDARPEYIAAIDPATAGQRKRRERDAAIVEALALYQGAPSARAKKLAVDWSRYLTTSWPRDRDKAELAPGERQLRVAIHRISRLADGDALSAKQIERIAAAASL